MNNVKLTIIFVLFLVFISPIILSLGIRFVPDRPMAETGGSIKVHAEKDLNFDLGPAKDNLVGVVVRVKNGIRNDTFLKLQLFDEKNNLIAESLVNSLSILDGSEVRFSFSSLTLQGATLQGVFTSDAIEQNAMEIYLKKGSENPAYVLLYRPVSHLDLVGNIYFGWLKHLFAD